MSRFNQVAVGSLMKTTNIAGGEAYAQSPELELLSILLTSFGEDSFYRDAKDTFARLRQLIGQCDKEFVAKACVYARKEFGMRSITHVCAAELARHLSGKAYAKDFYNAVINRPDDMTEIVAYYFANCADKNTKSLRKHATITKAMKGGFAMAFNRFDGYSLAKYRGDGKDVKLIDVVNMSHPIPTERNAAAIKQLVEGDLKSFNTWESKLSAAGQVAENEDEKADLKKDAWVNLVRGKKIKHMALLKNLRNIIEQAPEVVDEACALLTDEYQIKKSLVFPFRYLTAYIQIAKLTPSNSMRAVLKALNKALDISCANVPKFEGETLIVLDTSGSMTEPCNYKSEMTPAQMGAVFAAILAKSNDCDFMTFDKTARYVHLNALDSTITMINSIKYNGTDTCFETIFATANKRYDRVIIFSDQQGWNDSDLNRTYSAYKKRYDANPLLYTWDLKNYGTMKFPESRVLALAGFSDKVFDIMKYVEKDKRALVNAINAYSFASAANEARSAKTAKAASVKKKVHKVKEKPVAKKTAAKKKVAKRK